MALFPIPVTINLPLHSYIVLVALMKLSLSKSDSFAIDLLSDRIVFLQLLICFRCLSKQN